MIMPLFVVLGTSSAIIECYVSYKRITDYIALPNSASDNASNRRATAEPTHPIPANQVLTMKALSAGWKEGSTDINDISLTINKGETVVISGATGSGKSTLLQTALGATIIQSGEFHLASTALSYSDQKLWFVPNCTIKDNIQFGKDDDAELYQEVLRCCCLDYDMKALSSGDQTILDESATRLSGGQRRRVALARALYSSADLFLLDDIFNGIDAKTRQTIGRNLLGNNGFFGKRNSAVLISSAEGLDFLYNFTNVTSLHLSAQGLQPIQTKVISKPLQEELTESEPADGSMAMEKQEVSTPVEDDKGSSKEVACTTTSNKEAGSKHRKSPHLFFFSALGFGTVAIHALSRCGGIAADKASSK